MSRRASAWPRRLLVVAPHPDDETLGAGGLMYEVRRAGGTVDVALLTSGDGFVQDAQRYYLALEVNADEYLHLGYERQKECRRALAEVGVDPGRIHFFGFPDGGLDILWHDRWRKTFTSLTTGQRKGPYLHSAGEGLSYRGATLVEALTDLLRRVEPDWIVTPHPLDGHPDHWATDAFTSLAWLRAYAAGDPWARRVQRLSYLVHWPAWPLPLALRPDLAQRPPGQLAEPWLSRPLSEAAIAAKQAALNHYQSQLELIRPFMWAFVRATEAWAENGLAPVAESAAIDPRRPLSSWPEERTLDYQAPERDLMTRLVRGRNPIRGLAWARSGGYGLVRMALEPWEEPWRLWLRLYPADGTPWALEIDAGRGIVRGPGARTVHWEGEARDGLEVALAWPLPPGPTLAGAEVRSGERVIGRTGYRALRWDGDATEEEEAEQ